MSLTTREFPLTRPIHLAWYKNCNIMIPLSFCALEALSIAIQVYGSVITTSISAYNFPPVKQAARESAIIGAIGSCTIYGSISMLCWLMSRTSGASVLDFSNASVFFNLATLFALSFIPTMLVGFDIAQHNELIDKVNLGFTALSAFLGLCFALLSTSLLVSLGAVFYFACSKLYHKAKPCFKPNEPSQYQAPKAPTLKAPTFFQHSGDAEETKRDEQQNPAQQGLRMTPATEHSAELV